MDSALSNRLERFVRLEDCETRFIQSLEQKGKQCRKGHLLVDIGDHADKIWILKSGWAVLKSFTRTHGNQILRIFLPGEIIGASEFGGKRASHRICMQTDGVVTELCRAEFHNRLDEFPRLNSLIHAISCLNLTAFHFQVACLNSMNAQNNLKFFLLQLQSRLHAGQDKLGNRFELPMSQVEIGQVLGITSIYDNKLLRRFVESGQLDIDRPYFRLNTRETWVTETAYVDAFANIDTSWFSRDFTRPGASPNVVAGADQSLDPLCSLDRNRVSSQKAVLV